jgi:hypothetical protein
MRLLRLVAVAVVLTASVAFEGGRPATAASHCTCIRGTPTTCFDWDCRPVLVSTPFRPVRSVKDCRGSQTLLCDFNSCKLVCPSTQPSGR